MDTKKFTPALFASIAFSYGDSYTSVVLVYSTSNPLFCKICPIANVSFSVSSFSCLPLYTAPGSRPPCPASNIIEYGMFLPPINFFIIILCRTSHFVSSTVSLLPVLFCIFVPYAAFSP